MERDRGDSDSTYKNQIHNAHVAMIRQHPDIIGLDSIVLATAEGAFFKDGRLFHETDNLCFDPTTKTLYNVEYKCSDKQSVKAHLQLREEEDTLRRCFPNYKVVSLFVSSDYKVKKMRETL